ncbi:hypothetical protein Bca4012_084009 [Brassica carinata]
MRFRASSCPCFVILGRPRKFRFWTWVSAVGHKSPLNLFEYGFCFMFGYHHSMVTVQQQLSVGHPPVSEIIEIHDDQDEVVDINQGNLGSG